MRGFLTLLIFIPFLFQPVHAFELPAPLKVAKYGKSEDRKIKWNTPGRPKVLFFWASWCEYCEQFSKVLQKYSKNPDLEIYSIGTDLEKEKSYNAQMVKYPAFNKRSGWLSDEKRKQMNLDVVPVVVIIDRKGSIDTIYIGSQSDKLGYFEKRLKALVNIEDNEGAI